jgi:hypothetical protein
LTTKATKSAFDSVLSFIVVMGLFGVGVYMLVRNIDNWNTQHAEFAVRRAVVDADAPEQMELPYRPSGRLVRRTDGSVWYLPDGDPPEQWFPPRK